MKKRVPIVQEQLARQSVMCIIKNMLFLQTYNVMKNVSTHSMINTSDGELDMKLELEDIGRNFTSAVIQIRGICIRINEFILYVA
jgi:hypothetical protein